MDSILEFFKTYASSLEARKFFIDLATETVEYREKNNIVRKDFMQLLLQLRNSGKVSKDGEWEINTSTTKTLTMEECAAQIFLFYLAGFDTSSSALTYCLYELIRNKDAMKKLRAEIDETLERNNNELTYESIHEMKYLELCILGIYIKLFYLIDTLLLLFSYRIGSKVSNPSVFKSNLYKRLSSARFNYDY